MLLLVRKQVARRDDTSTCLHIMKEDDRTEKIISPLCQVYLQQSSLLSILPSMLSHQIHTMTFQSMWMGFYKSHFINGDNRAHI